MNALICSGSTLDAEYLQLIYHFPHFLDVEKSHKDLKLEKVHQNTQQQCRITIKGFTLKQLSLYCTLSSLTLPKTVRLFNVSLRSQAPQQQYTVLFFSSMRRHGHSHKLTCSCALWYYTVGIPFSDA